MTEFTGRAIWTETNKVSFTHLFLPVSLLATWAVLTKALGVGGTIFRSGLLIDVQEHAVSTVVAFSIVRPEMACRHLCQIIAVQKFTLAVLLTQRIQPMFAHGRFRFDVQIWALVVGAFSFSEMFAYLAYVGTKMLVLLSQNRGIKMKALRLKRFAKFFGAFVSCWYVLCASEARKSSSFSSNCFSLTSNPKERSSLASKSMTSEVSNGRSEAPAPICDRRSAWVADALKSLPTLTQRTMFRALLGLALAALVCAAYGNVQSMTMHRHTPGIV